MKHVVRWNSQRGRSDRWATDLHCWPQIRLMRSRNHVRQKRVEATLLDTRLEDGRFMAYMIYPDIIIMTICMTMTCRSRPTCNFFWPLAQRRLAGRCSGSSNDSAVGIRLPGIMKRVVPRGRRRVHDHQRLNEHRTSVRPIDWRQDEPGLDESFGGPYSLDPSPSQATSPFPRRAGADDVHP